MSSPSSGPQRRRRAPPRRRAGVWDIGNHGIEVAPPGADAPHATPSPATRFDRRGRGRGSTRIADAVPGVFVENKRWTLSVHYRLADPGVVPELVGARRRRSRASSASTSPAARKCSSCVRRCEIDKGTAAFDARRAARRALGGASILCAGDDRTDEDMFRAFRWRGPGAVTVWVGPDSARRHDRGGVPRSGHLRRCCELLARS